MSVEAIEDGEHVHGCDVHGGFEEYVWRVIGHGLGVFGLEFELFEHFQKFVTPWRFGYGGLRSHGVHRGEKIKEVIHGFPF
ncbi:MAG TPA: hypothetical protein VK850_09205 [Candidatus Binatia bacterium]|nr:hypothetical protein [Candidatus Binatia bacterium]